ncbi:ABC transporter permease subunit [Tissierella pigra]|uniref:ABC transporter permease subunit n=1 Tax=Tissierella pigra TaxID=2607614 RepID=A0A6N7XLD3_9FIRM|nr:ABC transporter permease subunit [Tissierella pigra]MBU5425830.1 ABC transporter permease subunit [Tissierella pigra]MSU01592.1 ABC transporter permease subunit [Tissierella pigra]
MGKYIWFEFKRQIGQARTWFLILLIFILSFQKILDYKTKSLTETSAINFDSLGRYMENAGSRLLDEYKDGPKESQNASNVLIDIGTQMRIAAKEEDYTEWERLASFGYLIRGKAAVQRFGGLREESFRIKSMKFWDEVNGGIEYEDIDFKFGVLGSTREKVDTYLITAKYYNILYKNNLQPVEKYHMDSMMFLYHYFNHIIPIVIGFIILAIIFNSINDEWNTGSLKLILTQPFSRNKYLGSKTIVGILISLFIIIIPASIISIGYGVIDGFENYNYPVLFMKDTMITFKSLPDYLEKDIETRGYNDSLGISLYASAEGGDRDINKKLDFISLYKLLLLALVLLVSSVIFYVTLNLFISSIAKNPVIGFVFSGLITLVGTILSKKWTIKGGYNLSPFYMNNPVRILNGTYRVTALAALSVLLITALFIFLCNVIYYRGKDL